MNSQKKMLVYECLIVGHLMIPKQCLRWSALVGKLEMAGNF